jgi:hypothetical protein
VNLKHIIQAIKERIAALMPAPQMWSYSKVAELAAFDTDKKRKAVIAAVKAEWKASADAHGFKLQKNVVATETVLPMWKDGDGRFVDRGSGPAQGYKVTISGQLA